MNKQRMTWAVIGAFIASFVLAKVGMRDAAHETFGAAVTIMWLRLCISSNSELNRSGGTTVPR